MNISRSGRVRKRSSLLTDSEFQTPKKSIICGLESNPNQLRAQDKDAAAPSKVSAVEERGRQIFLVNVYL